MLKRPQLAIACALFLGHCITVPPTATKAFAQAVFPAPDALLQDAKHKEPKGGMSMQGGELVIRSGAGTPTAINRIAFSADGSLLIAAKDFGRVVVFDLSKHAVVHAFETNQGIVKSVAISPDNKNIAVAGDQENGKVILWSLTDGKRLRSIDVQAPVVQELAFLSNQLLFVKENGQPIYVIDVSDGHKVFETDHESWATLSADGSLLVTSVADSFVVRSMSDFSIIRKLPKPTRESFPAAVSAKQDLLVVEDTSNRQGFVALKLSDGSSLPYKPLGNELAANPSAGYFVGIKEGSGIVFGHSQARLWAWNPSTGRSCQTGLLYSEAGALSRDGNTVASGLDNGFFSGKKAATGVEVWTASEVMKACGLSGIEAEP
jgi:WD40 repeat protein